jgi:hypothetical protein
MFATAAPHPSFVQRLLRHDDVLRTRPQVTRWYALHLEQGETEEMPPAQGRLVVHCRKGAVWITHDGDPKDVILDANESYAVARPNRMTMHALHGDCGLEIQLDAV